MDFDVKSRAIQKDVDFQLPLGDAVVSKVPVY